MTISEPKLPSLEGWEPTRDTLHAYAKVVGAFPRVLARPHEQWWHVSLKLDHGLLWSEELDPDGQRLQLSMDLRRHSITIHTPRGDLEAIDMQAGETANQVAERIKVSLAAAGLRAEPPREKYENEDPRTYDPETATRYLEALELVYEVQASVRACLEGRTGPVQLWPHNFDQAFEWFSAKQVQVEGDTHAPSQINFGFAPGDASHARPYFYSNPWPFDPALTRHELPAGARWFDAGWTGSLLPYDNLAAGDGAQQELAAYYQTVYRLAAPGLLE